MVLPFLLDFYFFRFSVALAPPRATVKQIQLASKPSAKAPAAVVVVAATIPLINESIFFLLSTYYSAK